MKKRIHGLMAKMAARFQTLDTFRRDRKGSAGVEFAIIIPLLMMAYVGAFEVSVGYGVARKVARASSSVADILTQQDQVSKATLDGMSDVAESIIAPYDMTGYTLKITGIKVTALGVGLVAWSRDQAGGTPYKIGSITTIPGNLATVNAFLVRTELVVPHEILLYAPGLAGSSLNKIDLSKIYYFRQRVGAEIKCTDCT